MFLLGGTIRASCSPSGRFGRQLVAGVKQLIGIDSFSESIILDFAIRLLILACCVPSAYVVDVDVFLFGGTFRAFYSLSGWFGRQLVAGVVLTVVLIDSSSKSSKSATLDFVHNWSFLLTLFGGWLLAGFG